VVSVLVALTIMLTGGLRQAPVNANTDSHATVQIGTACVMERGGPQICR
jgi:hypothetical protein